MFKLTLPLIVGVSLLTGSAIYAINSGNCEPNPREQGRIPVKNWP
jgi:hypothetical protein